MTRLWEFLEHEGEPGYQDIESYADNWKLSGLGRIGGIDERNKILNNKYVYCSTAVRCWFGKSKTISWFCLATMSDMRQEGSLVFDKILIVVDRIQLRDQLNEMMPGIKPEQGKLYGGDG